MELRNRIFYRIMALVGLLIVLAGLVMCAYAIRLNRHDRKAQGRTLAVLIAKEVNKFVIWDDRIAVRELLDHAMIVNPQLRYAFVERNAIPYVGTLAAGIPADLLSRDSGSSRQAADREFRDESGAVFYDIAAHVGSDHTIVHIGIDRARADRAALALILGIAAVGAVLCLLIIPAARYASLAITREVDAMTSRLRQANDELESKVAERTVEISAVNGRLRAEIAERQERELEIRKLNETLELRVSQRTAQLEATNKELEAFSYSVSHDLRAPLRHIDGFAGLMEEQAAGSMDENSRHYLHVIRSAARKMGLLIDGLLDFSRIGRFELQKTDIPLGSLVDEVVADFRLDGVGRRIDWVIHPLPAVLADSTALRRVFENLIGNAVKYTRRCEEARIEIGSLNHSEATRAARPLVDPAMPQTRPDEVTCFVRDNGVGFDMQYANKLFGVFQRLHAENEFEGTGIGLANVQRIILRHGGRVWAEGKLGEGATFYFTLQRGNPARAENSGCDPASKRG